MLKNIISSLDEDSVKDIIFEGSVFVNGHFVKGKYSLLYGKIIKDGRKPQLRGTLLKGPVNFHVHTSDSFISKEPRGSIPEIVGPSGFKMNEINSASTNTVETYRKKSLQFMKMRGTAACFDFVEKSGTKGFNLRGFQRFILARPRDDVEVEAKLKNSTGFGMSSLSDCDYDWLLHLSRISKVSGKIFAIHFSENVKEDIEKLSKLNPSFVVHCIECKEDDLKVLRKKRIPVVITPRSNVSLGKRPDYKRLLDAGLTVLLGTDNVFLTEPDMWSEADFLYRYQKADRRIAPEDILKIMIENPRKVIGKLGISIDEETYVLYPDQELSAYEIVTKPNLHKRKVFVVKKLNG